MGTVQEEVVFALVSNLGVQTTGLAQPLLPTALWYISNSKHCWKNKKGRSPNEMTRLSQFMMVGGRLTQEEVTLTGTVQILSPDMPGSIRSFWAFQPE